MSCDDVIGYLSNVYEKKFFVKLRNFMVFILYIWFCSLYY